MGKRRITVEEVDARLKAIGFTRTSEFRKNTAVRVQISCRCGTEYKARPTDIFNGIECHKCNYSKRKNTVRFSGGGSSGGQQRHSRLSPDEVTATLTENNLKAEEPYPGNTKVSFKVRCEKEHVWETTLKRIRQGKQCKHCFRSGQLIGEDNARRVLGEHGYTHVGSLPNSSKHKFTARCRLGHEWVTTLKNLSRGHRCRECYIISVTVSSDTIGRLLNDKRLTPMETVPNGSERKFRVRGPCNHQWKTCYNYLERNQGCPSCARDPWMKNGIYLLTHPEMSTQYVGISWRPSLRIEEHREREDEVGEVARAIDAPYELTYGEVFNLLDVGWEEEELPERVQNWFESNPHGYLPPGKLWFVDWFNMSKVKLNEPARVPQFVAKWCESQLIKDLSENHPSDNPFIQASKGTLGNIAENRISA